MTNGKEIRYFSMFTGVGGFELGLQCERFRTQTKNPSKRQKEVGNTGNVDIQNKWGDGCLGQSSKEYTCVGFSEIDKYASQLLAAKFPNIKNYGDATKINTNELPDFDMLCGGYPCQSFSIAGKRKGFNDTRGTMFFQIKRIAQAKQPKIILLENVKGILSHNGGNTWKIITQHLNSLGYLVDYRILNSKYFGVPQNRERVFHIGYNLKWMIKENLKDGQTERNTLLDKMLKGWMLENLLKDLEELKKLPEVKLKEWVLNYLRYICGNQSRLEYSKTINTLQINKSQNLLKEHLRLSLTKEENSELISKREENNLKMVQDILESMMEKGTDCGFIELWQKSISEILKGNNQSITSILIKKIIGKKTFSCAEINLIIGLFILQQKDYWEKWLNLEISDLIKLKEFIQNEGRRNKTKLRERYLLRNIRTSMGFVESFNEPRNFIIGNLRGQPRPEILPFRAINSNINEKNAQRNDIAHCLQVGDKARGSYVKVLDVYNKNIRNEIPALSDPCHNNIRLVCNSESQTSRVCNMIGISPTMPTSGGGRHTPMIAIPVLTPDRIEKKQNGRRFKEDGEPAFTITQQDIHGVYDGIKIRRLTPTECERLQEFPDGWTNGFSDTQRYKMIGNAVTTNVITAIASKLITNNLTQ